MDNGYYKGDIKEMNIEEETSNETKKDIKQVIVFIVVMLTSGWIGVLINKLLSQEQSVDSLGSLLWILTPLVMVVVYRFKDHEWKQSGLFPHFKGNIKYYLLAILFYPIVTLLTVGLGLLFNQVETQQFSWAVFLPVMMTSILANFFKNISEEIAWRGYLTQKLFSLKIKEWKTYLITGLVWNLWHGAYYLVFLPDEYFQGSSRIMLLTWGCVLLIVWSILYGEIYKRTNSIWPCVLMHAVEDGVPTVLVMTGGYITFTKTGSFYLHPITGLLSVILLGGMGLYLMLKKRKLTK